MKEELMKIVFALGIGAIFYYMWISAGQFIAFSMIAYAIIDFSTKDL